MLASLLVYLHRTTHPRVVRLAPDPRRPRRFVPASARSAAAARSVDILRIDGSLFFGAVEHVRDALEAARRERPDVRHVLLVATAVNFVDVAGASCSCQVAREMREAGSTLYVSGLKPQVRDVLERAACSIRSAAIGCSTPRTRRCARSARDRPGPS